MLLSQQASITLAQQTFNTQDEYQAKISDDMYFKNIDKHATELAGSEFEQNLFS